MINSMRFVAVFTGLLAWTLSAQTFTAKVVGVHDGDTITVYDGREQSRIRLDGIDCPETGADFSTRAKQLTSDLRVVATGLITNLGFTTAILNPRPLGNEGDEGGRL